MNSSSGAAFIHAIAVRYAAVKNLMFSALPFSIPQGGRDYIVLGLLFMSVTNVGFYQRTGTVFIVRLLPQVSPTPLFEDINKRDKTDEIVSLISETIMVVGVLPFVSMGIFDHFFAPVSGSKDILKVDFPVFFVALMVGCGALFAWRWIIGLRWSHFLTQRAKVDSPIQRTTHHEDAETVFG
jgi:hypothetical protein